jgi:thiopeptide-type bacteriocin biosynthesis protein
VFLPGSEWHSLKLYAGPLVVDQLVRDVIGPLGEGARWFFVRYGDPHSHLRVRFHGARRDVIDEAVAALVADGRVWKVQIDTYEREIERYGGPMGIGPCEELFHADSVACVELLGALGDDGRGDRRWRLAFLAMDRLLDDLGLDLEGKLAVVRRGRDGMRAEFRTGVEAQARVGAKYRAESKSLSFDGEEWADARAVLDRRSRAAAPAVEALRRGGVSAAEIAQSLLHMHCNRLLRSAQTTQEMVLYDFLCRRYEGLLARGAPRRSV